MSTNTTLVKNAVNAFREAERVQFLLDKKQSALVLAVASMAATCTDEERADYAIATDLIIAEYNEKREAANLLD